MTPEALKTPFSSVTSSFLAARSTCSLRLAAFACPGLVLNPGLTGGKPPVYILPHRPSHLGCPWVEARGTAPHALPPWTGWLPQQRRQGIEVRTVTGSPPEPIFTRLCRYLGLGDCQTLGIKPFPPYPPPQAGEGREGWAPAVLDRTPPGTGGCLRCLLEGNQSLSLSSQIHQDV